MDNIGNNIEKKDFTSEGWKDIIKTHKNQLLKKYYDS